MTADDQWIPVTDSLPGWHEVLVQIGSRRLIASRSPDAVGGMGDWRIGERLVKVEPDDLWQELQPLFWRGP